MFFSLVRILDELRNFYREMRESNAKDAKEEK